MKEVVGVLSTDSTYIKENFIHDDKVNFFSRINTPLFAVKLSRILTKIDPPFNKDSLEYISFVNCYYWTDIIDQWFIALVDKSGNHYFYFYDKFMAEPVRHGGKFKKDYFYRLAENRYVNSGCDDKNEDYIIFGTIKDSKFDAYFSSQIYHGSDVEMFFDLLELISEER